MSIPPPPDLCCSQCSGLIRHAVLTPCCAASACLDCAVDTLAFNGNRCWDCFRSGDAVVRGAVGGRRASAAAQRILQDDLIPDRRLRRKVEEYLEGRGAVRVIKRERRDPDEDPPVLTSKIRVKRDPEEECQVEQDRPVTTPRVRVKKERQEIQYGNGNSGVRMDEVAEETVGQSHGKKISKDRISPESAPPKRDYVKIKKEKAKEDEKKRSLKDEARMMQELARDFAPPSPVSKKEEDEIADLPDGMDSPVSVKREREPSPEMIDLTADDGAKDGSASKCLLCDADDHPTKRCPALLGQTCKTCGVKGHLAFCCPRRKARRGESSVTSNEDEAANVLKKVAEEVNDDDHDDDERRKSSSDRKRRSSKKRKRDKEVSRDREIESLQNTVHQLLKNVERLERRRSTSDLDASTSTTASSSSGGGTDRRNRSRSPVRVRQRSPQPRSRSKKHKHRSKKDEHRSKKDEHRSKKDEHRHKKRRSPQPSTSASSTGGSKKSTPSPRKVQCLDKKFEWTRSDQKSPATKSKEKDGNDAGVHAESKDASPTLPPSSSPGKNSKSKDGAGCHVELKEAFPTLSPSPSSKSSTSKNLDNTDASCPVGSKESSPTLPPSSMSLSDSSASGGDEKRSTKKAENSETVAKQDFKPRFADRSGSNSRNSSFTDLREKLAGSPVDHLDSKDKRRAKSASKSERESSSSSVNSPDARKKRPHKPIVWASDSSNEKPRSELKDGLPVKESTAVKDTFQGNNDHATAQSNIDSHKNNAYNGSKRSLSPYSEKAAGQRPKRKRISWPGSAEETLKSPAAKPASPAQNAVEVKQECADLAVNTHGDWMSVPEVAQVRHADSPFCVCRKWRSSRRKCFRCPTFNIVSCVEYVCALPADQEWAEIELTVRPAVSSEKWPGVKPMLDGMQLKVLPTSGARFEINGFRTALGSRGRAFLRAVMKRKPGEIGDVNFVNFKGMPLGLCQIRPKGFKKEEEAEEDGVEVPLEDGEFNEGELEEEENEDLRKALAFRRESPQHHADDRGGDLRKILERRKSERRGPEGDQRISRLPVVEGDSSPRRDYIQESRHRSSERDCSSERVYRDYFQGSNRDRDDDFASPSRGSRRTCDY